MVHSPAVVVDTMAVSALVNASREPAPAASYRSLIARRPSVVSFATVTELRYGALKAGWGELRRRGLERDLARFVIVQPDDQLMQACAELRASANGPVTHSARRCMRPIVGSRPAPSGSGSSWSPTMRCFATLQGLPSCRDRPERGGERLPPKGDPAIVERSTR